MLDEDMGERMNIAKEDIELNLIRLVPGEKLHVDLINDTESPRIYELDDMYVILPDSETYSKYPTMSKASLSRYASSDVELISKDEIEKMATKYLENICKSASLHKGDQTCE